MAVFLPCSPPRLSCTPPQHFPPCFHPRVGPSCTTLNFFVLVLVLFAPSQGYLGGVLLLAFFPFTPSFLYHLLYHLRRTRTGIYTPPLPRRVFPSAPTSSIVLSVFYHSGCLFVCFAAVTTLNPHRIILSPFLRTTNLVNSEAPFLFSAFPLPSTRPH